jgi:hypothetical protein
MPLTPDTQIISIIQIALIGILVVLGLFFLWRKIQRLEHRVESLQGMLEHCSLCPATATAPLATAAPPQPILVAPGQAAQAAAQLGGTLSPKRRFGVYEAAEYKEPVSGADEDYAEADDEYDEDETNYEDGNAEDEDDEGDDDDDYGIELNPEEEAAIQRIFKNSLLNGLADSLGAAAGGDAAFMVFNPFGFNQHPQMVEEPVEEAPLNAPIIEEIPTDADTTTGTRWTKSKLTKMNVEQLKDVLTRHHLSTEGTKKQLFERALEHLVSAPKSMEA